MTSSAAFFSMNPWNKLDTTLILASRSPRRKQILENMGMSFSVHIPNIENENDYIFFHTLDESIQNLALAKAQTIAARFESPLVLGCDTIVVVDEQVIGKPADRDDAKSMLKKLSGRLHKVYSGIALIRSEIHFAKTSSACTEVVFREMADWEIDEYLLNNEYIDKAGAYAIQGRAMTFIDKINGCFYNVMGLPVSKTIDLFRAYNEFSKGRK